MFHQSQTGLMIVEDHDDNGKNQYTAEGLNSPFINQSPKNNQQR